MAINASITKDDTGWTVAVADIDSDGTHVKEVFRDHFIYFEDVLKFIDNREMFLKSHTVNYNLK